MNPIRSLTEAIKFLKAHDDCIKTVFLESIAENKKGIISFSINRELGLYEFGFIKIDRRKIKFINLESNLLKSIPVYYEINYNGERIFAIKGQFPSLILA